jgi:hypothetical protein
MILHILNISLAYDGKAIEIVTGWFSILAPMDVGPNEYYQSKPVMGGPLAAFPPVGTRGGEVHSSSCPYRKQQSMHLIADPGR